MNKLNWYYNIYWSIKNIANIDKQKKSWLVKNSETVSSFDEDIAFLYDDFCFDFFLKKEKENIGKELYEDLSHLDIILSKYLAENKYKSDSDILEDQNWIRITNHAKKCLGSYKS